MKRTAVFPVIYRLIRSHLTATFRLPVTAGLLVGIAWASLTVSVPGAQAQAPQKAKNAKQSRVNAEPRDGTGSVSGRCVNHEDDAPLAGIVVRLYRAEGRTGSPVEAARTVTDAGGRFRFVVPEGRYDFLAEAKDRVCVAAIGRECLGGEQLELPSFQLISGGFISGRVFNTVTRQVVSLSEQGDPIMLGLYGPSQPQGRAISPLRLAAVDATGRFTLRAAPGENFPYFVNTRGVRMAWDTRKQPAVIVKEGETTNYDLLITLEASPEEKLKAARQLVAEMAKDPQQRTSQIVLEFLRLQPWRDRYPISSRRGTPLPSFVA